MIKSKYIRSLIYLTEKTITSLALEAGIDPTNLSRSLKGHSTVSAEKMENVLEHLGVDPVTGTLKPVVHRWRFNLRKSIELGELLPELLPGGGEIIGLALKRNRDYLWTAIVGNNGTRIIMNDAIMVLEDGSPVAKVIPLEEFLPEWKESYRIITPADLKKLIDNKTLSPSEFDEILGLNYETHLSDGSSFAREDEAENACWTWNLIFKKAKEAGLTPREVAKRLGFDQ